MPDREQGDHWDFLAADLGAAPAPKEETKAEQPEIPELELEPETAEEPVSEPPAEAVNEEPEEEKSPEAPPKRQPGRTGDRVVSGFGYRRGSVDWANLARELGVEALEEAPEPIPPSEPVTASAVEPLSVDFAVRAEPELAEDSEPAAAEARASESSERWAEQVAEPSDEAFGLGILDGSEAETPSSQAQDERSDTADQEERKGRRRRRRRKPKRQEQDSEQTESVEPLEVGEAEEPAQEAKESEEERSRRRGRRRGGRKRTAPKRQEAQPDGFAAGLGAEEDGPEESDEFDLIESDAFLDLEDDEDGEEDESPGARTYGSERSRDKDGDTKRKKVTHRGIPSWSEAVGHIVDSNMEERSKKPEPSGSRYRPGRRRGGDRSGNRS